MSKMPHVPNQISLVFRADGLSKTSSPNQSYRPLDIGLVFPGPDLETYPARLRPSILTIFTLVAAVLLPMRRRLFSGRKRVKVSANALGQGNQTMNDSHPTAATPEEVFPSKLRNIGEAKDDYQRERIALQEREDSKSWDGDARRAASSLEIQAAKIIYKIREDERDNLFGNKASESIPGPETLDMGGQFLTNKDRIEKRSKLYRIARKLPKGAHLHIHFNAELPPLELIKKAAKIPNMFIRCTTPLVKPEDYEVTEVVFNVLPSNTVTGDIFSSKYKPEWKIPTNNSWMKWSTFQDEFRRRRRGMEAEEWVRKKMVLSEDEVYNIQQTTNGIWARFNQATRCFKGLFNYESIYRWYIREAIENMITDKVMYAELRPMLMDKFIPSDDGEIKLYHSDQMRIILEEVEKMQKELRDNGELDKFPFGLKIIYCAPRSIPKEMMHREMQDCIKLKKEFPNLICGFDLVGAEDRPNHIGYYRDELLAMVKACEELNIEIPFMFHAGETLLDTGGSRDPSHSNLYDAVLLNARRIGHGFSLLKHPILIEEFKKRQICIELCPTSNELLHLCRNIKEHPYPEILAMGIPCTVNSDNPSLFSNSVSHEFYQVMVGSPSMSLYGWHQLTEWSITHSCLSAEEKVQAHEILKREWIDFCQWVVDEYGAHASQLDIPS